MKRWKGAALLLLCTVVMLRLLQGLAQPEKENAHVPVLGIVTTAAEDEPNVFNHSIKTIQISAHDIVHIPSLRQRNIFRRSRIYLHWLLICGII